MSKKKQQWISFREDGIRYMECKVCQSEYVPCDEDIVAVTCSHCVTKLDMIKLEIQRAEEYQPGETK